MKTDKTKVKEINPNLAWIRGETAYLLASIKSISSSIQSYTVEDKKTYYFEVNSITCTYLDKKQAYREYGDLVDRLNAFHSPFLTYKTKE